MATVRIVLRRGTAAEWEAANTVLALAEAGVETDTGQFKLGDGVTPWITLPYAAVIQASVGTTAQRPASPAQGMIRFNTSRECFEGYTGSAWVNMSPLTVDDVGATA